MQQHLITYAGRGGARVAYTTAYGALETQRYTMLAELEGHTGVRAERADRVDPSTLMTGRVER